MKEFGSGHSKRRVVAVQSRFRIRHRQETSPVSGLARFPVREKPGHADPDLAALLPKPDRLAGNADCKIHQQREPRA